MSTRDTPRVATDDAIVEFGERVRRGYDPDVVEAHLRRIAHAVGDLQSRLDQTGQDDESLELVRATRRSVDEALAQARETADRIVAEARESADIMRDMFVATSGLPEADLVASSRSPAYPGPFVRDDVDELRSRLTDAMAPSLAQCDPVPHATVEQARRYAILKQHLLESGAFTYGALTEGWGVTLQTARKRVERACARYELFTVTHDGETLLPAFLLDSVMELRPELQPAIEALVEAGEGGWALWTWFVTPSPWLDGRIPESAARESPDLVEMAARERASAMA